VDPAFYSLFTGLLKPETDVAVAEARELHHALHFLKISLGDPEVAKGILISHSAEFLLDKQGLKQRFWIADVDSLRGGGEGSCCHGGSSFTPMCWGCACLTDVGL
jgi:hypothetical protein